MWIARNIETKVEYKLTDEQKKAYEADRNLAGKYTYTKIPGATRPKGVEKKKTAKKED